MTIELPADVEERARARVNAGEYASLDQVVRAGLEALDLLDDEDVIAPDEWLARAQQRWAEGDEAVARGEYVLCHSRASFPPPRRTSKRCCFVP